MWKGSTYTATQEIEEVEIMKYMTWSRKELQETPIDIINTIKIRMSLESKDANNV